MTKRKSKIMAWVIVFAMILGIFIPTGVVNADATVSSDIQGHWAERQIQAWLDQGLATGYGDGIFKPNNQITRAEFFTFVNKAFKFTESATIDFSDVQDTDWFYGEIAKAKKAQYISGYEDGTIRPNNPISRQEVAVIIEKVLKLETPSNDDVLDRFKDKNDIPQWSKGAIASIVANELMGGYPDGTFQPVKSITRAEAVVTLDAAMNKQAEDIPAEPVEETKSETKNTGGGGSSSGGSNNNKTTTYAKAGTYGPESGTTTIKGDVVVKAEDITLRNMTITGDLVLGQEIGDGDVTLEGVIVQGTTTVNGGGAHSIHFSNSTLLTVIVNKNDGTVRIVAEGSTVVQEVQIQSSAVVQEENLDANASGFTNVTLSDQMPSNANVELLSTLETVNVFAANVTINTQADTNIESLILNAVAQVLGEANIRSARINANASGSTIASAPTETLVIAGGATATVNGEEKNENDNTGFITTLTDIDATLGSIALDFEDMISGLTANDFIVTAAVYGQDGEGTPYPLENLRYDRNINRLTFQPIFLEDNIGKEFVVTVTPAEGSALIQGQAITDQITIDYGFEGRITDIYGRAVQDLTIKFREGATATTGEVIKTAITDKYGYYSVTLEPGMYCGEFVKDGYYTTYLIATSLSYVYNVGQNETVILAANEDEIKIMLTWGQHPQDLDSHLLGPTPDGGTFHTAFYDKRALYNDEVYVDLDWDDVYSFGPETTTIRKVLDGKYRFFVHHWYGQSTLSDSGAKIEVYKGAELLKTYEVPTDGGSKIYWLAFDMVVDGEDITFTQIDAMGDAEPSLMSFVNVDVTTTNNIGANDCVEVIGLSEGEIVKLYSQAEGGEPFAISVPVAAGDNTITFEGLDLEADSGTFWMTITNELYQEEESERVAVEYPGETMMGTVVDAVYYDNAIDGNFIDMVSMNSEGEYVVNNTMDYLVVTFSEGIDGEVGNIVDLFGTEDLTVTNAVYDSVYSSVYDGQYLYIDTQDLQLVSGKNTVTVTGGDTTVIFSVYKED